MKNFRKIAFGLLVGSLALGFSAFTTAPRNQKDLNTYFSKIVGTTGWTWVTSPPAHETCKSTSLQVSCSVDAASQPADNTMPAGAPIDNDTYQP